MKKERIREGWEIGREAWPEVEVSEEDFAAFVGDRVRNETGSHASPLWSDLYLACACARGNPKALRIFDTVLFPQIEPALKRVAPSVSADDVRQLLHQKLFVGEPGKPGKIADYAGRGALRTWLRITATRTALDLGGQAREVPVEGVALEFIIGAGQDPELDYFKQRYAAEFRAAFADAFAALEPRDRSLLRYAFGKGLSIDAIGTIYGVHRATAARWVVTAHEDLVKGLRKTMIARLDVKPDEYASILRLIESRIEVSFERLLREGTSKM